MHFIQSRLISEIGNFQVVHDPGYRIVGNELLRQSKNFLFTFYKPAGVENLVRANPVCQRFQDLLVIDALIAFNRNYLGFTGQTIAHLAQSHSYIPPSLCAFVFATFDGHAGIFVIVRSTVQFSSVSLQLINEGICQ